MERFTIVAACILAASVMFPAAQEPNPIELASDTLGTSRVSTLQFSAHGAIFLVGQSPNSSEAWPRVTLRSYEATINYETMSSRVDVVREQGAIPPRGGGQAFVGEQGLSQFVSGNHAWNLPPPPAPPQPQPAAAAERTLQIWLTPHGFLKAAITHTATTKRVPTGTEVTITVGGKHKLTGLINAKHHVERVQTRIAGPVHGDVLVEAVYRDYENVNGMLFPMHITQQLGGQPSLELSVDSVQPNAPADIVVPEAVRELATMEDRSRAAGRGAK